MRALIGLALVVVIGVIAAFALGLIDIDNTRVGKLPTIEAKGGQLPGFDVKAGSIDVGTKKQTVDVPTVGTKKESVDVPTVEVKKAK